MRRKQLFSAALAATLVCSAVAGCSKSSDAETTAASTTAAATTVAEGTTVADTTEATTAEDKTTAEDTKAETTVEDTTKNEENAADPAEDTTEAAEETEKETEGTEETEEIKETEGDETAPVDFEPVDIEISDDASDIAEAIVKVLQSDTIGQSSRINVFSKGLDAEGEEIGSLEVNLVATVLGNYNGEMKAEFTLEADVKGDESIEGFDQAATIGGLLNGLKVTVAFKDNVLYFDASTILDKALDMALVMGQNIDPILEQLGTSKEELAKYTRFAISFGDADLSVKGVDEIKEVAKTFGTIASKILSTPGLITKNDDGTYAITVNNDNIADLAAYAKTALAENIGDIYDGILAVYKANDFASAIGGVANSLLSQAKDIAGEVLPEELYEQVGPAIEQVEGQLPTIVDTLNQKLSEVITDAEEGRDGYVQKILSEIYALEIPDGIETEIKFDLGLTDEGIASKVDINQEKQGEETTTVIEGAAISQLVSYDGEIEVEDTDSYASLNELAKFAFGVYSRFAQLSQGEAGEDESYEEDYEINEDEEDYEGSEDEEDVEDVIEE